MRNIELENEIRNKLIALSEEKYRDFSKKLIPGCENILGVRIPTIKKLAKDIAKENPYEYLNNTEDIYFEETMLKGLIIGNLKDDLNLIFKQISIFVPKITNWSLCDSFCSNLKIAKKYEKEFWNFIQSFLNSSEAYSIRFGTIMILGYFIQEEYLDRIFSYFNTIKHPDYYVKMGVAWTISMCYVKFPNETYNYLLTCDLDDFTFNKAIQKTRESTRIDQKTKEILNKMKR